MTAPSAITAAPAPPQPHPGERIVVPDGPFERVSLWCLARQGHAILLGSVGSVPAYLIPAQPHPRAG